MCRLKKIQLHEGIFLAFTFWVEAQDKIQKENMILVQRMERRMHCYEGFSHMDPHYHENMATPRGQRKRREEMSRIQQENLVSFSMVEFSCLDIDPKS
jgi:hypothetical protein